MVIIAVGIETSVDLSVERSFHSHCSEQNRPPIFGGVDQHLDSQSPFRRIAF
jgi:hypothetical protein